MSTLPLAAASKLTQVMELYRIKTQGDVSKLTWSLAAYGCAGEKKIYTKQTTPHTHTCVTQQDCSQ